ncbi:MAG: hypothetical protein Q4B70_17175 [Lachnospiraceae bacterium]|nr:hypothetical protein [Lachnospiraceae bacterium]
MKIADLTYDEGGMIIGFYLTYCIGPPKWQSKAGFSRKKDFKH